MTAGITSVDPGWLALRGPADDRARRAGANGLADELGRWLRRARPEGPARLVDVGAGTGAGAVWLRPRIQLDQRWRLLDLDPDLLALAEPVREGWAEPVVADLGRLGDLLAEEPADGVTCQALLDVLTGPAVRAVVDPTVSSRAALLAALTVTGRVSVIPDHPDDALVTRAFNAHQRRDGRLGPDAAAFLADRLREHGYAVRTAATPWCLDGQDRALTDAWLCGRAEAALEQEPAERDRISAWLAERRSAARRGLLAAVVDHVDVLGIPTGRPTNGMRPARQRDRKTPA